jgi:hypothetical protein
MKNLLHPSSASWQIRADSDDRKSIILLFPVYRNLGGKSITRWYNFKDKFQLDLEKLSI